MCHCCQFLSQCISFRRTNHFPQGANHRSASLISEYYPNDEPTLKQAASTSLASALYSVQMSWEGSPQYTSANAATYSAAPDSIGSSISSDGYYYRSITGQDWYTNSVSHAVQTAVAGKIRAFDAAAQKILSTATSTGNAAPARTAAPFIFGAIVLVGGVFAAM
jgi:hypothetical protein